MISNCRTRYVPVLFVHLSGQISEFGYKNIELKAWISDRNHMKLWNVITHLFRVVLGIECQADIPYTIKRECIVVIGELSDVGSNTIFMITGLYFFVSA